MAETGLFFRALPDKSLVVKGSDHAGGNKSKERLTVALCVSASGEIEKPLVIGKSLKPRCFKSVDTKKLPHFYQFIHWFIVHDKNINNFASVKILLHVHVSIFLVSATMVLTYRRGLCCYCWTMHHVTLLIWDFPMSPCSFYQLTQHQCCNH